MLRLVSVSIAAGVLLLLPGCTPKTFADFAEARAQEALGPAPPYITRELETYVDGDHALVVVRETENSNVAVMDPPTDQQVLVGRSGVTRIFTSEHVGEAHIIWKSHDRKLSQDRLGVRRVAQALLPVGARIYHEHRYGTAAQPRWEVYALTSVLSDSVPHGLIVEVLDTLAILQTRFPAGARESVAQ